MANVKIILSGFLLIFLMAGCAVSANPALIRDVALFQEAAHGLAAVVETHIEDAEKANKAVLLDNITLQFDLGGTPDILIPPLFTPQERAARKMLLDALQLYSINLREALGTGPQAGIDTGAEVLTLGGLRDLSPENFDLSHSMDRFQTRELVSSLSNLSHFLLAPKRDRELGRITQDAHPSIQKLALLLYFDMGASRDQDHECRFSSPAEIDVEKPVLLNLCKGGLRGLMAMAIAANIGTWQQRLKLNKGGGNNAKNRTSIINHMLSLQQTGEQQDRAMIQTQRALLALVRAHRELAEKLSGNRQDTSLGDQASLHVMRSSIGIFSNSVGNLKEMTKEAGNFFLHKSMEYR